MQKNTSMLKNKKGFTIVETLVAMLCGIIVIVGAVLTLTVSTKFANLERAETIAQNIAKNIMAQKINNSKFDTVNGLLGTNSTKVIPLYDFRTPNTNNFGTSDTLYKEIRIIPNSKCNLVLTSLETGKKINAKVEILWSLNDDGTITDKTRKVELSSIITQFNFTDTSYKKSALEKNINLANLPPKPSCSSPTDRPSGCACSETGQCLTGSCIDNPNTATKSLMPKICS